MTKKKPGIELLAPAGSPSCLKAALIAGADAVYLAGKRFGARAFAQNFDEKNLRWARRVTSSLKRKLYITLNTIVFDEEWGLLKEALDFYEGLQPDALIIQDLGIIEELKKRKSQIPIHLSTQGAWFGVGALEELKEAGVTRIILPRELTSSEIIEVAKNNDIELETFVHGAMCYSISGRCFWSIALGSRSGNRGTCAQPCRKEYFPQGKSRFGDCFFSPKDLRLYSRLAELKKSGVVSLKIEGRMKTPEYVFQVVNAYKKALEANVPAQENALDEVFSRQSAEGFFDGKIEDWRTGKNPGRAGVLVAQTTGRKRDGLVELNLKSDLKPGDGIFWFHGDHRKGSRITFVKKDTKKKTKVWVRGLSGKIPEGTDLFRSGNAEEGKWELHWKKEWERRPVTLFWSGHEGQPLAVEFKMNGHSARLLSDEKLGLALNKGLELGILDEKFNVLGDFFRAERHVTKALGGLLFLSAKSLKRLKRAIVETLTKLECLPPPQKKPQFNISFPDLIKVNAQQTEDIVKPEPVKVADKVFIRVWNKSFPFLRDLNPDAWILPLEMEGNKADLVISSKREYWIPPVFNQEQLQGVFDKLEKMSPTNFLCLGWEAFALKKQLPQHNFRIDWTFNLCNSLAAKFVSKNNLGVTFGKEWKLNHLPVDINGVKVPKAWNPLVSLSRFPEALKKHEVVHNAHNDRFFSLDLGNGMTGLFMIDKIASVAYQSNSKFQLDVAVAPNENPIQVAKDLNRIIVSLRSAKP